MVNSPKVKKTIKRWIKENKYLRYIRLAQPEPRVWFREEGTLPDFLIVGAQRSGTTYLYDYLSQSTTALSSPLQKEIHFFDNKFYKGIDWYSKFFRNLSCEGSKIKNFEASPYYLYHPSVPKRVSEYMPNVKILAVLRNPVERAMSHYRWSVQLGFEERSPTEAFREDARMADLELKKEYLEQFDDPLYFDFEHIHHSYIRRSMYHIQIRRWLDYFDYSQFMFIDSSMLFRETSQVIEELSQFLNVHKIKSTDEVVPNKNDSEIDCHFGKDEIDFLTNELNHIGTRLRDLLSSNVVIGEFRF